MAITRVPGITVACDGKRIINKAHRGARVFARLGIITQEHAERRLRREIQRINADLERKARPLFHQCAARYLDDQAKAVPKYNSLARADAGRAFRSD